MTEPPPEMSEIRDRIVLATLVHVPFDGWCPASLRAGARDAGFDETMAERAFLAGPADAVAHFAALADRQFEAEAATAGLESLPLSDRLVRLIKLRLSAWVEHREAIRRAVSLLTLPGNTPLALRMTWRTADSLWHAIGDDAVDFSYYTKRATLGAIYSATMLFWLEDQSEDFAETWAFLDRRMTDATRLPKLTKDLKAQLDRLPNPLALLNGRVTKAKRRFGVRG